MTSTVDTTVKEASVPLEGVPLLSEPAAAAVKEQEKGEKEEPRELTGRERLGMFFAVLFIAAGVALLLLISLEIVTNIYAAVHQCQSRTIIYLTFVEKNTLPNCFPDALVWVEYGLAAIVAVPFVVAGGA
jgi:hypothetical protein